MDRKSPTFLSVAAWLWDEIRARGRLDEEAAAALVRQAFGPRFVTRVKGKPLRVSCHVVYRLHRLAGGRIDHFSSPGKCRLWIARPG
ncbi:MAG TPA: hypothetical protein VKE40_08960 [Gemmataceae bacterium]|nr:hypothetical protein [Gemmataceae bacterium]